MVLNHPAALLPSLPLTLWVLFSVEERLSPRPESSEVAVLDQ